MIKIEKSKAPGKITCDADYRKEPVFGCICKDFHGKCYLCEYKSTSYRVEHIVPRDRAPECAHKWENLFLACPHCNEIKGNKYNNILDCTKVDPEDVISIKYNPFPMARPEFAIKDANDPVSTQVEQTVELLNKIFIEPTTVEKLYEADTLCDKLYEEIDDFLNDIQKYRKATGKNKGKCYTYVSEHIGRSSSFAAIKRAIVRERYLHIFGTELDKQ